MRDTEVSGVPIGEDEPLILSLVSASRVRKSAAEQGLGGFGLLR
jgi:hypothetical protein